MMPPTATCHVPTGHIVTCHVLLATSPRVTSPVATPPPVLYPTATLQSDIPCTFYPLQYLAAALEASPDDQASAMQHFEEKRLPQVHAMGRLSEAGFGGVVGGSLRMRTPLKHPSDTL